MSAAIARVPGTRSVSHMRIKPDLLIHHPAPLIATGGDDTLIRLYVLRADAV